MGTDGLAGIGPVPLVLARARIGDGTARLSVAGEIDMATSGQLATALTDALREPRVTHLVVDLGQVTFLDSTGIAALLAARRQADGNGIGFVIANCRDMVRRVLEITGVYKTLTNGEVA